jgi:hypothetical protein
MARSTALLFYVEASACLKTITKSIFMFGRTLKEVGDESGWHSGAELLYP